MRRREAKYRDTEVRALVENYAAFAGDRDTTNRGMRALVAIADLKTAWRLLGDIDREVLLVMGILGLTSREAGEYFEKSHAWAQKSYRIALENLTYEMNGGSR